MSSKAIAYYRVSTARQGQSGLGLEAQQAAVRSYAQRAGLVLIGEYTEVETGMKKRRRVEIHRAITAAKDASAVLLIAKLDRLARNVAFVSTLMESGVDFVACDMPPANRLTVHIMAALAEWEAEMISKRTKEALAAAKARGTILGKPENLTPEAQAKGAVATRRQAVEAYRTAVGYIKRLRQDGLSFGAIAQRLNEEGHRTRTGKLFYPMTVQRILNRTAA